MQIVTKNVADLIFAEYNSRQLTQKQHKDLKDSIKRFGLVDPIIVNIHSDRENVIVGGHQRVRIAQEMGIMDVPCVEVNLDADREKELNIRLNKNLGEWDMDALANYFDEDKLMDYGFTDMELGVNMDEPQTKKETKTLKPFEKSHILISFDPQNISEVAKAIEKKNNM